MTDVELLEAAKEIIAKGCGCDRACEDMQEQDVYCGCKHEANQIIGLVRKQAEERSR